MLRNSLRIVSCTSRIEKFDLKAFVHSSIEQMDIDPSGIICTSSRSGSLIIILLNWNVWAIEERLDFSSFQSFAFSQSKFIAYWNIMTSLQYSHQSRCPPLAVDSVTCPPVDSMEFHKKKSCSFAAKKLSTCSHDSSKLETEEKNFAINQSMTSQRTEFLKSLIDSDDGDCDGDFTVSGSNPPKTSGALGRQHDSFAKYARCGHWSTCKKEKCGDKKYFTPCGTCKGPGKIKKYTILSESLTTINCSTVRSLWALEQDWPDEVHLSEGGLYQVYLPDPKATADYMRLLESTDGKNGTVAVKWIMQIQRATFRTVPTFRSLQKPWTVRRMDHARMAWILPTPDSLSTMLDAKEERLSTLHSLPPSAVPTMLLNFKLLKVMQSRENIWKVLCNKNSFEYPVVSINVLSSKRLRKNKWKSTHVRRHSWRLSATSCWHSSRSVNSVDCPCWTSARCKGTKRIF